MRRTRPYSKCSGNCCAAPDRRRIRGIRVTNTHAGGQVGAAEVPQIHMTERQQPFSAMRSGRSYWGNTIPPRGHFWNRDSALRLRPESYAKALQIPDGIAAARKSAVRCHERTYPVQQTTCTSCTIFHDYVVVRPGIRNGISCQQARALRHASFVPLCF